MRIITCGLPPMTLAWMNLKRKTFQQMNLSKKMRSNDLVYILPVNAHTELYSFSFCQNVVNGTLINFQTCLMGTDTFSINKDTSHCNEEELSFADQINTLSLAKHDLHQPYCIYLMEMFALSVIIIIDVNITGIISSFFPPEADSQFQSNLAQCKFR